MNIDEYIRNLNKILYRRSLEISLNQWKIKKGILTV